LPDQSLTADDAITRTVPYADGVLLAGTFAKGLQLFGQQFIPLVVDGPLAGPYRINDLCVMPDGHFAAAVDGFGLVYF